MWTAPVLNDGRTRRSIIIIIISRSNLWLLIRRFRLVWLHQPDASSGPAYKYRYHRCTYRRPGGQSIVHPRGRSNWTMAVKIADLGHYASFKRAIEEWFHDYPHASPITSMIQQKLTIDSFMVSSWVFSSLERNFPGISNPKKNVPLLRLFRKLIMLYFELVGCILSVSYVSTPNKRGTYRMPRSKNVHREPLPRSKIE